MKSVHWHDDDQGFYSVSSDGVIHDIKLEERDSLKNPIYTLANYKPSSLISISNSTLFIGGKTLEEPTEENKV